MSEKLIEKTPSRQNSVVNENKYVTGVTFKGKLFGVEDVKQETGDDTCQDAMIKLKAVIDAKKQHKQRINIKIDLEGIELIDEKTNTVLYKNSVNRISYIARDPKDARAIGFIYKSGPNEFKYFGLRTEKQAQEVFIALKELFEVVLELRKAKAEENQQQNATPVQPSSPQVTQTSSQPASPQPQVSQPASPQPPVSQPASQQPPVSQPASSQPPVSQPASQQPPVSQPASPQPPVLQPASPQPVIQQQISQQPAVTQPVSPQPVQPVKTLDSLLDISEVPIQNVPANNQPAKASNDVFGLLDEPIMSTPAPSQPSHQNQDLFGLMDATQTVVQATVQVAQQTVNNSLNLLEELKAPLNPYAELSSLSVNANTNQLNMNFQGLNISAPLSPTQMSATSPTLLQPQQQAPLIASQQPQQQQQQQQFPFNNQQRPNYSSIPAFQPAPAQPAQINPFANGFNLMSNPTNQPMNQFQAQRPSVPNINQPVNNNQQFNDLFNNSLNFP